MNVLGNIYLTWRAGRGMRRHKVGVISRYGVDGVRFNYIISPEDAVKTGFTPYTDFPDLSKTYTENVLDIFGQRLTKSERDDIQKYYDFWEIKPQYKEDKYYLLAHTQGLLATDNFEFLADYSPLEGLSFTSEICGLSHYETPSNVLNEGDELQWEYDSSNTYDKEAVKVLKNNMLIGYVKIVHSGVFYKNGGNFLKIKVKSVDKNGKLNRAFIKVYL
ncbi:MAG: hypothetical protein LBQ31_08390 [Bacteroidales bacterium]|jgi:hypothetical protein|nr:hypothetical protein [Bacteroidales bacterium]